VGYQAGGPRFRRGGVLVEGTLPIVKTRVLLSASRDIAPLVPGWLGEWGTGRGRLVSAGGSVGFGTVPVVTGSGSLDRQPERRSACPWVGEGWGTRWGGLVSTEGLAGLWGQSRSRNIAALVRWGAAGAERVTAVRVRFRAPVRGSRRAPGTDTDTHADPGTDTATSTATVMVRVGAASLNEPDVWPIAD